MRPDVKMPPLKPVWLLLLLGGLLLAVAACGGGNDQSSFQSGQLTDPRNVPTTTPWQQPPAAFIIDPNAIKPISGGGTATPTGAPGEPGVCSATYTVVEGDYPDMIAEKCGITRQQLYDANPGLEPTKLHIGDALVIPNVKPSPAP